MNIVPDMIIATDHAYWWFMGINLVLVMVNLLIVMFSTIPHVMSESLKRWPIHDKSAARKWFEAKGILVSWPHLSTQACGIATALWV